MRAAGLDIGSRTVELVVLDGTTGEVVQSEQTDTTPDVARDCERLVSDVTFDRILATGYGRSMAEIRFGLPTVTEIKAHARGAHALFPDCRTILDIGGQDTKAISLGETGRVLKFEMNDRCAAGAGRFLEMMAAALRFDLEEFGSAALRGAEGVQLSSMCAVFAESEVIGLMTCGTERADIARAVHHAVARRTAGMLRRVSVSAPIVFAGGAAKNDCLVEMLKDLLGLQVVVPDEPQMVGALGAALLAAE